jgi:hypothetical protein
MPLTLPQNYASKTGLIRASDLGQNFDALAAKFGAIDNADLAADAGIRVEQLANRYSIWKCHKMVLGLTAPHTGVWDGTIADAQDRVEFDSAAGVYTSTPERIFAGSGVTHELYGLAITLEHLGSGGGVTLTCRKNGSAIIQTATQLTASGYYEVGNANPEQAPFDFFLNADVIDYTVERIGASDVHFRAVYVTEYWRARHTF